MTESGLRSAFPVWATIGRTDLTLSLLLTRDQASAPRSELHDVHVL